MQVKPFMLLGKSTLDAVQAQLAQVATDWAAAWGLPASQVSVRAERAHECGALKAPGAPAWTECAGSQERNIWLAWPSAMVTELQRLLFAPDGTYGPDSQEQAYFAPAAARKSFDALLGALCQAAMPGAEALPRVPATVVPAPLFERGAGTIVLLVGVGKHQCRLLLNEACVRALGAKGGAVRLPPLAKVNYPAAVADVAVALQLKIGAARVGLGNLMTLSVGDVIRLDSSVDAPVALTAPSGATLFNAYLGRVGNSVAVEVVGSN